MRLDRIIEKQDSELDALLLQAQAPAPQTNFSQNVWRQIRLGAFEPRAALFGAFWLPRAVTAAFVCLLLASGLAIGDHFSRSVSVRKTEVRIPTLQPQTLAGTYLTVHTGR